jgi:predicted Zn-ribbon and HTH transcriptional regulator
MDEDGERLGLGPGGYCVCPDCGYREKHRKGVPCSDMKCPKCGANMKREENG